MTNPTFIRLSSDLVFEKRIYVDRIIICVQAVKRVTAITDTFQIVCHFALVKENLKDLYSSPNYLLRNVLEGCTLLY